MPGARSAICRRWSTRRSLREAYNSNLPKLSRFGSALAQNLALYAQYKALAEAPEAAHYDAARRKVLENALRDFRLGGAELDDASKARFAQVQEELSALAAKFSQNVLDATDAWSYVSEDATELSGLPAEVVAAARAAAEKDGVPGWKLTLQMPCYLPVQTDADNREPARAAVPRQRRARLRVRRCRAGQQRQYRSYPGPARRAGTAARLCQLRGVFGRHQDGAKPG